MLVTLLGRSTTVRGKEQKSNRGGYYVSDAVRLLIHWRVCRRNSRGQVALGLTMPAAEKLGEGKMTTLRRRFLCAIGAVLLVGLLSTCGLAESGGGWRQGVASVISSVARRKRG